VRIEGRFEGRLRTRGGDQLIRIEDGRFAVEGIPRSALLRP
jgi:hypothetical protein